MPPTIKSFGFRHGLTISGDIVFSPNPTKKRDPWFIVGTPGISEAFVVDVRRLLPKNPYHDKKLRKLRGDSPEVIAELEHTQGIEKAYHELLGVVSKINHPVYIGCTGGHHRSVYIANRLGKDLNIPVEHLNYHDK